MDSLILKANTTLPKSLRPTGPAPETARKYNHIANRKLRTTLQRQSANTGRSKALLRDAELLLPNEAGKMEVEGDIDRTWRISQDEIISSINVEAARGRKEFALDGGPYRARYTRNGRHMAVVGQKGHVATFDWQTGTMHSELQLRETCRDITYVLSTLSSMGFIAPSFLQDHSQYAVAQKKYVFIYDRDGVELHRLKSHIEPMCLEFLPFHWLLASVVCKLPRIVTHIWFDYWQGNAGYLKYQDVSTGQLVAEHRTKLGACVTMTQNKHNAVIHLGHQNGTVTLWTPNLPYPAVRLLAHLGPVCSVSVDQSTGGRYMATAGVDGIVKVWDCRSWKEALRSWDTRGGTSILAWSQRGCLAVASGGAVNVYSQPSIHTPHPVPSPPPLYVTHPQPAKPHTSLVFCPFQDVLAIGHAAGVSCILVPGAGEPNFDSSEVDPFEGSKARREREVKSLLDKVPFSTLPFLFSLPHMIALDPEFLGGFAPHSKVTEGLDPDTLTFTRQTRLDRLRIQGKADETEDVSEDEAAVEYPADISNPPKRDRVGREKHKTRGKGKSLKRYLRKQRKNVIDPRIVAIREALVEQRTKARPAADDRSKSERPSALDRFYHRR
ncbi:BING4CT-domain-containing protein [Russula compacta]|nr:BING4CT-domain-containing protein [Russula compacta]